MKLKSLVLPQGLLWGIVLTIGLISFGCSKDECVYPTQETPPTTIQDVYYVKYELKSSFSWGNRDVIITIKMADNSFNTFIAGQGSTWNKTIGPVEKGFKTSLNAVAEYSAHFTGAVYTSKNNGAFALKAIQESDSSQKSYTMSYIVE